MKRFACLLLLIFSAAPVVGQDAKPRPMEIDDLFRFKRLADPQISPDGKWVVYVQGTVDLEGNRITKNLWLVSADGAQPPKQFTSTNKSDSHPRWSPDGKHILFESNRSGEQQLWIIATDGGEARQLTKISTGASEGIWSRDGRHIAFVSAVWPEFSTKPFSESDALNKKRIDEKEKDPVKAKIFTRLFFRHWDEYVEDKRQHLFVADVQEDAHGLPSVGLPRDVTPGDRDAFPTSTTFSSSVDFTFTPDSKHLVFTAVPAKHEAWSTNYDLCRVSIDNKSTEWECLTEDNLAADGGPQFSSDGKWLAFRAQKTPGYEADKWDLVAYEASPDGKLTGKRRLMTGFVDASVESFLWLPGKETIVYDVENKGGTRVYLAEPAKEAGPRILFGSSQLSSLSVGGDGQTLLFLRASLNAPNEVCRHKIGEGSIGSITHVNDELQKKIDAAKAESVSVPGAGGTPMQMWILKPPGFDANKKWPFVYMVHGGPQGAWEDCWSYRWNPKLWAAQGYVVALPNPRGSTGFGQKYVDEISGDWGGKCYEDLMAGVAYLEKQPYIDSERMAAAGASFGGYMMNWFAVNTGKFKTLISHCGVWNFDSMYAVTEELWFDEWEHGGPPWGTNRESYEKFSPHKKAANLGKFKTPMLIIQNDLDFRVPVSEGIQLFTSLQRQGVPARMINFPDEGHWVLKPRNSQMWHREVFGWLKTYVAPGGR